MENCLRSSQQTLQLKDAVKAWAEALLLVNGSPQEWDSMWQLEGHSETKYRKIWINDLDQFSDWHSCLLCMCMPLYLPGCIGFWIDAYCFKDWCDQQALLFWTVDNRMCFAYTLPGFRVQSIPQGVFQKRLEVDFHQKLVVWPLKQQLKTCYNLSPPAFGKDKFRHFRSVAWSSVLTSFVTL